MQNSLNKRIKEIISLEKLSDTQFANKIGVPQTTVSNIFKRDSDVKSSLLNRILDVYPYVSPTWLLRGMGEMYLQDNAVMLSAETTGGIPFYDHAIECGTPADFDACIEADKADGKIMLPNIQGDFALVAHGDSMVDVEHPDRSIPSGAIVVLRKIDEITFIRWGEVYALATRDGFVIKRIMPLDSDNIECHSFNGSEFPPFQMRKSDIVGMARVIAVVTCKLY